MFDLPNKDQIPSIGERNRDAVLIELAKRRRINLLSLRERARVRVG